MKNNLNSRSPIRLTQTVFSLLALCICFILPVHGATYLVNSTADLVDQLPGDGLCASSNGECSLRAAIQESNQTTVVDEIIIPAGEFILSLPGIDEDAAATGDLDLLQPMVISGAGSTQTVIKGQFLDRVFEVLPHAGEQFIQFNGMTITEGQYSEFDQPAGSGLLINGQDVEFSDVIITGNNTLRRGAAALHITDSCVHGSEMRISHNTGDQAQSTVFIEGPDSCLDLDKFSITDNQIDGRAAIFYHDSASSTLKRGLIARNQSRTSTILLNADNLVTMENVTISGNQGSGAILNDGGSELYIHHSTITNNTGINGASTVVGGISDVHGGTGLVYLTNSIVSGNGPGSLADDISRGNSLHGGNILGEVTGYAPLPSDVLGVTPQLGPLQDLGGFAEGHRPDVVWVDLALTDVCLPEDQRGQPRPWDGDMDGKSLCDAGAIELITDVIFADGYELKASSR